MPFEKIKRIGDGIEDNQQVNIRPTVLIGLGGTGKEVLMRLRRMFYEKYRVAGLPVMEYLWFDTDIRNIDITRAKPDCLDSLVHFSAQEKIDGRIRPNDLDGYRRVKGVYPYIWEWFPDELDAIPSDAIMQGAGQIRPCGRLAFFHHYQEIRETIEEKASWVTSADCIQLMNKEFPNYQVDQTALEIIIVTSIGGGTGSGCFIDVGFLCRELYPNSVRTAFIVMPNVFDDVLTGGEKEAVHSNGFASLKELEYYMQPRFVDKNVADGADGSTYTTHEFYWDGQQHLVEAPPFTTNYLIDNTNFGEEQIKEITDTFQMIAEFLLLDFDRTGFATAKRSVRSNLEQYMGELAPFRNGQYVHYFPCRYASIGLSQIELNQPRLANAAATRFAQYLIEFMLAPDNKVPPGYSEANVRPHLERMDLTTERIINRILLRTGQDFPLPERVIHDHVDPSFEKLIEEFGNVPAVTDRNGLDKQVMNAQREVQKIVRNTIDIVGKALKELGTVRGNDLKKILENISDLQPELEEKVEKYCISLLCNPLEYGPKFMIGFLMFALEALEEIQTELDTVAANPLQDPEVGRIEVKLNDKVVLYESRLREAQDLVLAWQTKRIAINTYRKKYQRAIQQNAQAFTRDFIGQLEEVRTGLKGWVRERYRKEASRRFLDLLMDDLIGFLGHRVELKGEGGLVQIETSGLQAKVKQFQDNLQEMADRFHQLHEAYKQRPSTIRNLNLMPDLVYPKEIQKFLKKVRREADKTYADFRAIQEDMLRLYFIDKVAEPLFASIVHGDTKVVDAIKACTREIFDRSANRRNDSQAWDEIESTIDRYTFELFRKFKAEITAPEEFAAQISHSEHDEEIKRRANYAEPRISKPGQTIPEMKYYGRYTLGLPNPGHKLAIEVNDLVKPKVEGSNKYQPTQHASDSIVFVGQWMAFPLFAVGNLVELNRAYEKNLSTNPVNVFRRHLTKDYSKYPEILPPSTDAEVKALIEAQQPLIDGILLGKIQYDLKDGFFRPYKKLGVVLVDSFGPNLELARLAISRDRALRDRLTSDVQSVKLKWRAEDNRKLRIRYLNLFNHLLNKVFPSTMLFVLNKNVEADTVFRILLNEAYNKECRVISEQFGCSEEELEQLIEESDSIITFATPLPYRDSYCKDKIYLMEG